MYKVTTMHFQRLTRIFYLIQVNFFHRDFSQQQVIQNEPESITLWECETLTYLLLADVFKDSAVKLQTLNKFNH